LGPLRGDSIAFFFLLFKPVVLPPSRKQGLFPQRRSRASLFSPPLEKFPLFFFLFRGVPADELRQPLPPPSKHEGLFPPEVKVELSFLFFDHMAAFCYAAYTAFKEIPFFPSFPFPKIWPSTDHGCLRRFPWSKGD